jgi:antagonist of KipI
MDTEALATLNALLGNESSAAAIEWALTGGEIEFTDPVMFAIGGAQFDAQLDGSDVESYRVYRAQSGSVLSIRAITLGRFVYVAFAGGLDIQVVLGSASTYLPGSFGGLEGRRLKNGDTIAVRPDAARRKSVVMDKLPFTLHPSLDHTLRVVTREHPEVLLDAEWEISAACDRTGYRLKGTAVLFGASITSEPVCPGTIQLPPSGEPIVLMADAPTVGGYRILGTVISTDLGVLAQMPPGHAVPFESVSVEAAQRAAVDAAERIQSVRDWALA